MWKAVKKSLLGILGSKKAVMAIAGVAVGVGAKYGIELSTEDVAAVLSPVIAYLIGQGVADHGKGKAEIEGAE